MQKGYVLRAAHTADAGEIAKHRGLMFLDMELIAQDDAEALTDASVAWFGNLIARGQYKGWIVEFDHQIVAGAGIHLSVIGPLPGRLRVSNAAHIANVYTHARHRKQGIARLLLNEILSWCRESKVDQVTLTTSAEGRALYTSLGFMPQMDSMVLMLE